MHILFIGEAFSNKHTVLMLKNAGMNVTNANTADKALRAVTSASYDAVVINDFYRLPSDNLRDTDNGFKTGLRLYEAIRDKNTLLPIWILEHVLTKDGCDIYGSVRSKDASLTILPVEQTLPSELLKNLLAKKPKAHGPQHLTHG